MTQLYRSFLALIGIATIAVTGLTTPAQGADLGEALDSVKWRGILGTWVDSETKGERVTVAYAWKFENKLIEVNSKMGETESVSLMGFNPDTEEVFMMGGNNKGGGSIGQWSMDGEDAMLELSYVSETGDRGTMKIKHHRVDEDTIKITGSSEEGGEEFSVTLVRAK
jgi:hypothetical protein